MRSPCALEETPLKVLDLLDVDEPPGGDYVILHQGEQVGSARENFRVAPRPYRAS